MFVNILAVTPGALIPAADRQAFFSAEHFPPVKAQFPENCLCVPGSVRVKRNTFPVFGIRYRGIPITISIDIMFGIARMDDCADHGCFPFLKKLSLG